MSNGSTSTYEHVDAVVKNNLKKKNYASSTVQLKFSIKIYNIVNKIDNPYQQRFENLRKMNRTYCKIFVGNTLP